MTELIIYLVGFILCFIIFWKRTKNEFQTEWADINASIFFSLTSWLGVIFMLFIIISDYLKDIKPPKWL